MSYEKYHKSLIDCKQVRPYVKELVLRCGNAKAAGEYSLVAASTIHRILHNVHCTVQQETARKLFLALQHRREEDRKNHEVHDELLKARKEQARQEDRLERLIGY